MSRIRKDTEAPQWVTEPETETPKLPMHKPFPERTWERSKPTDRCPECGKTVREHQAELKAALSALELKSIHL